MTDMNDADTPELADAASDWYRSPLALVAALVLFVGALALIVLAVTGSDDSATTVSSTETALPADTSAGISFEDNAGQGLAEIGEVTLDGDVLPPIGDGTDDQAIGTRAPAITAVSLASGNPITLDGGSARILGFFAHWCPHCQRELPEVAAWLADNKLPPNTEFIAVSTAVSESRDNYPPSAWFDDVGWSSPVILDDADGTILNGFGFSGFPAFVAIDASGTVVGRLGGNIGTAGLDTLASSFAS